MYHKSHHTSLPRGVFVCLFLSEKLAARMELEFKRLQRRRLFMADTDSCPSSVPNSPGSSSGTGTGQASSSSSNKDQPLFTLKQVSYLL